MPVDWEDVEPVAAPEQQSGVDWEDVEPIGKPSVAAPSLSSPSLPIPVRLPGLDVPTFAELERSLPIAPEGTVGQDVKEFLSQDLIPIPSPLSAEEVQGVIPNKTAARATAGAMNVLESPGRFLNTPLGLFTLGAGPAVQKAIGLAMAPGMVKEGAAQLGEGTAEGDIQKIIEGGGSLAFGAGIAMPEAKTLGRAVGDRLPLTRGDVERIAYRDLSEMVNSPLMPPALRAQLERDPYASSIEKAATVYGNVRPQPGQGARQVPVQESRTGVQPRAPGVAEEAQVPLSEQISRLENDPSVTGKRLVGTNPDGSPKYEPELINKAKVRLLESLKSLRDQEELTAQKESGLSEEEQRYLQAEREGIDAPIEFATETGEGPFAGEIATINPETGAIVINPKEFSGWLRDDVPAKSRSKAVRSLLWEERIHLAVARWMAEHPNWNPANYWDALSPIEKAIAQRRYTGRWGTPREGVDISPENLGHEAIRYRMQQLARMEPREIAEAAFRERWTLKGLDAVEATVRAMREAFGKDVSGTPKAILDQMQNNLDIAKSIAAGATPGAMRKGTSPEPNEDQYATDKFVSKGVSKPSLGPKYFRDAGERVNDPEFWVDVMKRFTEGKLYPQESAYQAGLFLRQLGIDKATPVIEALREARQQIIDQADSVRERIEATENPEEKMRLLQSPDFFLGSTVQFPREIIESAFNEGSAEGVIPERAAPPLEAPTEVEVTPLEYESGRPLSATESLLQRLEGRPGALRKSKAPKEHPEFFLPPMKEGETRETHAPITPASVSGEIKAELAGGAHHPVAFKGGSATQEAKTFIAGVQRPDFENFATSIKAKYGDVQPGQLRDAWMSGVWDYLMKAPGAELSRLRSAFGIGKEVGLTQTIADPLPELPAVQPRLAFEPLGRRPKGVRAVEAQAKTQGQKYRNNIISILGEKLIRQSETGKKAWNRKEVSPEEIGFWRQSTEPAMTAIAPEELRNPEVLGQALTADARSEGSTRFVRAGKAGEPKVEIRRKAPPVSVTKRLTALEDKRTGKVELVSTYRDPRRGAVLLDPHSPGQTHSQLASILKRFRPIYSFLLDEPVQNFRETFKSRAEFSDKFLSEARNRQANFARAESELSTGAGVLEGETAVPGVLEIGGNLTDAEAGSFLDNLYDEVSKLESPEDIRLLVDSLHTKFESGELTGRDWQTISTLQKATDAIQRKWPQLTPDQSKEQAFDELYDLASKAESRDAFAAQASQKYSRETRKAVPSKPQTPQVSPTARELTMLNRLPPTVQRGVQLPKGPGPEPTLPPPQPPAMLTKRQRNWVNKVAHSPKIEETETSWPYPVESAPKAIRKSRAVIEDEFLNVAGQLSAWTSRRETKADIVRWRDGADTIANNDSRKIGNAVRVQSKNPIVRAAAKAVIAAAGDKGRLDNFLASIETGRVKAENQLARGRLIAGVVPEDAIVARRWLEAVNKLRQEVEYAKAHWDDKELQDTAKAAVNELNAEMDFEVNNGVKIDPVRDYVPGRYEAEFFNDKAVMFGEAVLGRNFRKPKVFDNYYSAIQAGPYIPKTYDIADLVEHRARSGRRFVNRDLWIKSLRALKDPMTGQDVLARPKVKNGKNVVPSPEYELISVDDGGEVFAVRKGYKRVLSAMIKPSGISETAAGQIALAANGLLKHGVILILDTFHPFRLGQYALSLMGPQEAGYRGGWSALEYREADLGKAIQQGYVSKQSADWAGKPVEVTVNGRKLSYTRRQVLHEMQRQGLNVGRIQDAIYSDLVRSWPVVGTLNKWTFDVFTRGLMAESAVRSFEKLNQKYPNRDVRKTMKEVITDVNVYYGSLGRQSWIRSPTLRDISQILFLAPQWVEGLVRKELTTYGRIAKSPLSVYRGEPILGTLGSGMAKGFVSYLVLTQLLNLMTRRHLTFQNPESDHKLDAWFPTGEDSGFWVSPLSVFGEVTHDIARLGIEKPTYEAFRQVGANKLGPFGRMLMVAATRENSQGQRITSTFGFGKEIASQLAPAPISLGTPVRYVGSKIAPGMIAAPPPGAIQQRVMGAAGIKVQTGKSALSQAQHLAEKFAQDNKLKKDTGFVLIPTDEASYSKLRAALRNNDKSGAKSILNDLRKTHKDEEIIKAMMIWNKRPLTGSWKGDILWLQQMDDHTFGLYAKALQQRQQLWNQFLQFYMTE